ncbi:hypothetical protein [Gelidibacter maritimus]|uniref:Carboxypeptidase-like regulatory domain-containing protein n=1 Tax=Gelidibacter maritimus TaxID=2761487 RepID=A0A7W2R3Y3_9FLAO|nr:hypothetical protein [Gelidibacter maritimus]MBA6153326.1 hypothetical protein [Gelidibacter maritimus]
MRNNLIFIILTWFFVITSHSQSMDVKGKINAPHEVDGIHIINKTASRFTISNSYGEFVIQAKLNDTILFSGISYQPKEVIVTKLIMASKEFTVYLEELVNALDEVVVGKVLTGDLLFDITNADLKRDLDFYDLGIPGYTGKLMTQTERRLREATSGGGLIPIFPIINAITGRTKRLKEYVKFEKLNTCLEKMKSDFSADLFNNYDLKDEKRAEFFYYCQDDPEFENLCKSKNDMATLQFLVAKLESFNAILQTQKD